MLYADCTKSLVQVVARRRCVVVRRAGEGSWGSCCQAGEIPGQVKRTSGGILGYWAQLSDKETSDLVMTVNKQYCCVLRRKRLTIQLRVLRCSQARSGQDIHLTQLQLLRAEVHRI